MCKTMSMTLSEDHLRVCSVIDEALKTEGARVLVCMPPRHGKTMLALALGALARAQRIRALTPQWRSTVADTTVDLLIIDVPTGEFNWESSWDWFTRQAFTRLAPGGRVVVFMSRLSVDDFAALLGWKTLDCPALTAEGKPSFPERFTLAQLEDIRSTVGLTTWNALYQQTPSVPGSDAVPLDLPSVLSVDDWEQQAQAAQVKLKLEVTL